MSINPKNFNKDYYYNVCFGSEEFKKSNGKTLGLRVKKMIDSLNLTKSMEILEIGCGRGDTALYIAKNVKSVIAIDYSKEGIKIAKKIRSLYSKKIQDKTKFLVMDASKLLFKNNSFDVVLLIDTIDHLNKKEQIDMLNQINRVLKPGGLLFVRTCSNRILLSYTYNYYIHPLNVFLTWVNKKIKGTNYASLPKESRTKEGKKQHINEPSYFSLKTLFKNTNFRGSIKSEVGFLKEGSGPRTKMYNFIIALYPLSKYFPLNILFTNSYICLLRKKRS